MIISPYNNTYISNSSRAKLNFGYYYGLSGNYGCQYNRERIDTGEPENFRTVNEYIYRGGNLVRGDSINFLSAHGVKTIISMKGSISDKARSKAWWKGIKVISLNLDNVDEVQNVLKTLANKRKGKFYIHCHRGFENTGILTALHRIKNENWSVEDAYKEYRDICRPYGMFHNFREFSEKFVNKYLERPDSFDRIAGK